MGWRTEEQIMMTSDDVEYADSYVDGIAKMMAMMTAKGLREEEKSGQNGSKDNKIQQKKL